MWDGNKVDADVLGTADAMNFYVANPSKSSPIAKRILEQNQGASENLFKFDEYIKPIVHNMSMNDEYKVDGVWPWQLNSNADGKLATNEMTLNLYRNKLTESKIPIVPMCGKTFSGISGELLPNGVSCRLPQSWYGYIPMSDLMIVDGYGPGSVDVYWFGGNGKDFKSSKNELVFKADDAYLDYTLFLKQIPEELSGIKKKMRTQIFFLLLIVDPSTKNEYLDIDVDKTFDDTMCRISGLNSLLSYPTEIISVLSLLQSAKNEYHNPKYNFSRYRKLILDAGAEVLKIKEV
jgi:hypothetical protein